MRPHVAASTQYKFKMKSAIVFCMFLGITLNFLNEVMAQNPELPEYGVDCVCADATSCGGMCECSCTSGTCESGPGFLAALDDGVMFTVGLGVDGEPGPWYHCSCLDGSNCAGSTTCHCDPETGACNALGKCDGPTQGPDPTPGPQH